jgi:hypothetical protein
MVLDFTKATKEQLLQIALYEACPNDLKFRACSEIQTRKLLKKADYLQQIVYLFGKGLLVPEIANVLSISHMKVEKIINQHELWRTRLQQERVRKDPFNRGRAGAHFQGKRVSY